MPDDALWAELEAGGRCVRVGDVLGPRSAEEAVLEGTLAARAVGAAARVAVWRAGAPAGSRSGASLRPWAGDEVAAADQQRRQHAAGDRDDRARR